MDAGKEKRWSAAVRELVIIVAGVIIALAANAWWQSRGERTREREYIEQLTADMTNALTTLDSTYRQEERTEIAIKSLLFGLASPQKPDADSVRSWLSAMGSYSDPRLVLGTVTALLQTGDLRLIRDRRVRVGVSAYASGVTVDLAEFSRFVDLAITANQPMMMEMYDRGLTFRDADAYTNAVIAMRNEPVTSMYMQTMWFATNNRRLYIERMRVATKNLLDVVKSHDISSKVAVPNGR